MLTINADDLHLAEDGSYVYEGRPFTGLARTYDRSGKLVEEAEYRDGLQDGVARYWHPTGEPAGEDHFRANGHSGLARRWYPDGKLQRETLFDHSIRVREQEWDAQGRLVKDYVLRDDDPLAEILRQARERDAGAPSSE